MKEITQSKTKFHLILCHGLGHYILKHDENTFVNRLINQENLLEREANIFSLWY